MTVHILLARQRSGTGALGSILNSHPEISYLGEVFHPNEIAKQNNYFNFLLKKIESDSYRGLPAANEVNYQEYMAHLKQFEASNNTFIDIKYSSTHHFNSYWHSPFDVPKLLQFCQKEGRKILHLKRKNYLKTFISGQLAEKNKIWHAKEKDNLKVTRIKLNPTQLLNYLKSTTFQVNQFDDFLHKYPHVLELEYEELFQNDGQLSQQIAEKIAGFLKIDHHPFENINTAFVKQTSDNLSEVIENYEEIRDCLDKNEFSWMLGDKKSKIASQPALLPGHDDPSLNFTTKQERTTSMNLKKLAEINNLSLAQVQNFRESLGLNFKPKINEHFHKYKNNYPYFGFIDVDVCENSFLMFSNNDDLIAMTFYWFGSSMYEPMSMQTWLERCKSAQNIYDVGAFSGVYSLSAAMQNPKSNIVAFEAVRRTYARLLLNIQTNQLTKRITPVNLAVSNKQDVVTFYQFRGENILGNGASMIMKDIPTTSSDEKVNTISLDEFIQQGNPLPDLLKIDVEGAEDLVLEGMKTILSEKKPQMLIEVTPQTAKTIDTTLKGLGYKIYAIDEHEMSLLPFSGSCSKVTNLLGE